MAKPTADAPEYAPWYDWRFLLPSELRAGDRVRLAVVNGDSLLVKRVARSNFHTYVTLEIPRGVWQTEPVLEALPLSASRSGYRQSGRRSATTHTNTA